MPMIVNTNLAGFTVKYNGVQFGGADATHKSLPPMYAVRGVHRWDEAGRAILGIDYTLSVRCIFFENSEAAMVGNMRSIRALLSVPGRLLEIKGLGAGFGIASSILSTPSGAVLDLANGPRPGPIEMTPIGGQLAWELSWSVSFFVSECVTSATFQLSFMAFNFTTTWRNDFEGLTQRVISGYAIIPQYRNPNIPKTVLHVAEELRGDVSANLPRLKIEVPPGFRRVENTWRESDDKSRLDFTIIDEQLQGDALPPGIVEASGACAFSSNDSRGGMASGTVTLQMSLKTAVNVHRNYAGLLFLGAALSKQLQLSAVVDDKPTITVVPISFNVVAGQFDRCRETQFSMTWALTKNLSAILNAANVWTPVSQLVSDSGLISTVQDYTQWKASMDSLWGNRASSGIGGSASEAAVIDLCDNITQKTIGATGSSPNDLTAANLPSLSCPDIPPNGGWFYWNLKIRVHRKDYQTTHRKAAAYSPSNPSMSDPGTGNSIPLGSPSYSQPASDRHVIERHGYPEVKIGMAFTAYRFKHRPFMPSIKTVAGLPVIEEPSDTAIPECVFDAFGCPLFRISGTRVYRVQGQVDSIKTIGSPVSGAHPLSDADLKELVL